MRSSLADYRLLGPFGPGGETDGSWLATPPSRLADIASTVVITVVRDPGEAGWHAFAARLGSLAAVHDERLPRLVEAGRSQEPDGPQAWVTRLAAEARPIAGDDLATTLRAVAAVARAAHALHEAGWAHGDIRPAAVLVSGDQVLLEPPLRAATTPGDITVPTTGTADLDPVESAVIWGEGPSRAGDIWALGATLHALVTGQLIHPALVDDPIVTAVQRVLLEPPQLSTGLDGELETLLRSCLAHDPAARPSTAADLADRLDALSASR